MNGREVVDSLIRHKKAPRMGLYDSPWSDTLDAWAGGQGYPVDSVSGLPAGAAAHFGFDMEGAGGGFDWMPIQGRNELLSETDEWAIHRNGAGAAFKYWKRKSGTPEHVDFHMTTRDIWEKSYRGELRACESRLNNAEAAADNLRTIRARGAWAFFGNLGLWEILRSSLGDECMFESFLLDPEWILDFNRVYTDFYKAMYDILFDTAGLPDGVWLYDDLAYRNGVYCSPKTLDKLFAPFYKEIADHIHSYGLPIVFHCCGGMEEALPMIAGCGYDALNPMERKSGCDPIKFARRYRDKLAFIGGLDAISLESSDLPRMLRETDDLLNGMRDAGAAYIFGSDHSLSPRVNYDDYCRVVEHFRENSSY